MNNSHRFIIQSFLSRGTLTHDEMKDLHKFACEKYEVTYAAKDLTQYVQTINRNIGQFSMEIRRGIEEDIGSQMYALVRTSESEMGKLSCLYQQNEIDLFKKTIALIVQSESGMASSTDILNLADHLDKNVKKMSKVEAQNLLKRLIKDKWLTENQGEVTLSARSILELEPILRETYPDDLTFCNLCKSIVIKGQCCTHCDLKLHLHCASRLFYGRDAPMCPGCKGRWEHEIIDMHIEEMNGNEEPRAGTSSSQTQRTSINSKARSGRPSKKRKN
ncbi:non-structural maintenance of chromosomes element 1 homolog [Saccoglossus kowalevskii]|uniref:Non-structural maintenance of chromosomes element 1 homolog n=1 Tax=Saccoglossus kowalevskii TaxID=10224 RepID=A0ABM0GT27_SACKO|nr:PREDICTED: non-structural maintenance of chromosomes element 1 homolog [Saccoglossus kowalevskii]